MHYLFRKAFCNILIQKFQNYNLSNFLSNYWCQKCCIFLFLRPVTKTHFPDHLQTATFQIIFFSWGWTSHIIKYLKIQCKMLPERRILLNKIVCFSSMAFSSAHVLFVSSQMIWCTLVFTLTDYILKYKNDVLEKIKLPKLHIC